MISSVYEAFYQFLSEYIFISLDLKVLEYIAMFITFIFFFAVLTAILSLLRIGGKK